MSTIEIVPAILRETFEEIERDWNIIEDAVNHIQIDITDGVFAGNGTFRDIKRFKQLTDSQKIELHMMVHTPSHFTEDIIDLAPARCIFHLESFDGTNSLEEVYTAIRDNTQTELAVAINPESPNERLESILHLVDYVMFMGYNPGWANQPINPIVFRKIGQFKDKHPDVRIAADGSVTAETVPQYVQAGATILCANTSIFDSGNPLENLSSLQRLAETAA